MRKKIAANMEILISMDIAEEYKEVFKNWLENKDNGELSKVSSREVEAILAENNIENEEVKVLIEEIRERADFLVKRSQWILGGDGWAYDIGYGGLDHVLACWTRRKCISI